MLYQITCTRITNPDSYREVQSAGWRMTGTCPPSGRRGHWGVYPPPGGIPVRPTGNSLKYLSSCTMCMNCTQKSMIKSNSDPRQI